MQTASNPQFSSLPQMPNATSLFQQISFFCSKIHDRSYDEGTVRILESILVSKDVISLTGVRSAVKQFMRDESLLIIREITEEPVELKLLCVDFLIRVFALVGDVESCLALRYEALVMREQKTTTFHGLQVSFEEWLIFAEHSVEKGFDSIANLACDKALNRLKANHEADSQTDEFSQEVQVIKKIKKLKDAAVRSVSSRSGLYLRFWLLDPIISSIALTANNLTCDLGKLVRPNVDDCAVVSCPRSYVYVNSQE